MVWNKDEGLLDPEHIAGAGWQKERVLPGNFQELMEEAFDTLVYLDEKLLNLEYAPDNEKLIRRVFGSLVRLYSLFWALRSHREFRMVALAKAFWSYAHHGTAPIERDQLLHMSGLTRSLEGYLIALSQRMDAGHVVQDQRESAYTMRRTIGAGRTRMAGTSERLNLEKRRRERDEQWLVGMDQRLRMIEMLALQSIVSHDSGEHDLPGVLSHPMHSNADPKVASGLPTDMSSLYTTLRELGSQIQELREHLGNQMTTVVRQSLLSMGSLYRFLRKGLRTLYSQSDETIGLHGLIFSCREKCLLLPTSAWLDIIPCEEAQFSQIGNDLLLCWDQHEQPLPVRSLCDISEPWTGSLSKDEMPAVGPAWLRDSLELHIPSTELPFSEVEQSAENSNALQGYCVVVQGAHSVYAIHTETIIGEMMVALLEAPDNPASFSPVQAVGLLPDARIVRVLDAARLEQTIGMAHPFESC